MKKLLPLLLLFAACKKDAPPAPAVEAADADVAPKEAHASDAGNAPACPPLDVAKAKPFECEPGTLPFPVPPLEDPKASMAPFYERLAALARGTAKDHVRIAMYGDSNLTADYLTGRLRRKLQERFGDGGHGYVALAHPWDWYSHNDVHHDGDWKKWKPVATSTNKVGDGNYGFANIASDGTTPGAAAWVSTDPVKGSPIGLTANKFDLFYAKRPGGGELEVQLDGNVVKTLDTKAEAWEAAFERFETTDAHHELRVVVKSGPVRVYGVAIERDPPSVQVDSLGCGSLNMEQMVQVKPDTRAAGLKRRDYDLVIIHLGTNMFGYDPTYRKLGKQIIDEFHQALPNLPFLMMSPPDALEEGQDYVDPRIARLVGTMKAIAVENDEAYWDFYAAMGGKGSIKTFMQRGLAGKDGIHLSREGDQMLADRMLCAITADWSKWLEKHPDAGCKATR
ncbi:MAG TPA: GDSL-type esterase/lipase family protein [Labilithrix sp.]